MSKAKWNRPTLWIPAAIIALSGCQKTHESPASEPSRPPAPQAAAPTADDLLRKAVSDELRKDKHLDQSGIRVAVTNGIVELSGQIDNALSEERATRIAEAVRGVWSVSNRLVVAAPARADSAIEQDVKKALAYNYATARLPIHVSVKGAVPTLTGTVRSWQEREFAERVADGVRGVRATRNDLQTKSNIQRDAKLVAADIKSRLAWDVLVEHDPITVAVKDGLVTLAGSAGSAAEKSRAIADGWVDGVKNVSGTAIAVKQWDRPDPNLRASLARTDAQIAKDIRDASSYDPRVESYNINPTVTKGVVTLTGTVETLQAKRAAEALARNTVGVVAVKNDLITHAQKPLSDSALEDRIETALAFDPLTDAKGVHVSVKKGEATLTGSVADFFDSAEALDVASRMVTVVNDKLQVQDQTVPYVYSAWLDPVTPYVDSWYLAAPRATSSDAAIEQRIKAEFSWNPFIVPIEVQVRVQAGKAILTGNVNTYLERQAAAEAAIEAGALGVDNQLKVS